MRKLAALALTFFLAWPMFASAQLTTGDSGLGTTGDAAYGSPEILDIGTYIGVFIIRPVLGITGILFVVLTVYAGFLWMTSQGDASRVKKAKDILIASVIGATIMALAYVITYAVINALSQGTAIAG